MHLSSLIDGLKDKTISILTFEHDLYQPLVEYLEQHYGSLCSIQESFRKENKDDMVKFVEGQFEVNVGGYVSPSSLDTRCGQCDSHLYIALLDNNTIIYAPQAVYLKLLKANKYKYHAQKEDFSACEALDLMNSKKLVAQINVATGKLVFDNFFRNEDLYSLPKDIKYSPPGIGSILGRNRLMQYLAAKDVGYGQMGNMSVTIFQSNDGEKIIVGSEYDYQTDNDIHHNGYKKLGTISLDVWRWMCADKSVLDNHGEKIGSRLPYAQPIIANVKPGKWQIEHFFDFNREDNGLGGTSTIYSTLSLVA